MIESLSHGHQIANLITTGALVGGFCALMAWGSATEARRPAVIIIKENKHKGVQLPNIKGDRNG